MYRREEASDNTLRRKANMIGHILRINCLHHGSDRDRKEKNMAL
jgi:hypothetical protein